MTINNRKTTQNTISIFPTVEIEPSMWFCLCAVTINDCCSDDVRVIWVSTPNSNGFAQEVYIAVALAAEGAGGKDDGVAVNRRIDRRLNRGILHAGLETGSGRPIVYTRRTGIDVNSLCVGRATD